MLASTRDSRFWRAASMPGLESVYDLEVAVARLPLFLEVFLDDDYITNEHKGIPR